MIAYLKGHTHSIQQNGIILLTNNIGYQVKVTKTLLSQIQEGQEIELFIHNHIREDAFDLYGFQDQKTLSFFKLLININGIGPKVALEILNQNIDQIQSAIFNNDTDFLKAIPGIGNKTAQRIILELKGKIDFLPSAGRTHQNVNTEATDALTQLGYKNHEIQKVLKGLPENLTTTEEIITYFLKHA